MPNADEKLRADARTNRERILGAARLALAADPEASMFSIARAAGVGQGTLYRHFPNREALVLAVYRQGVEELAELGPALLASHPPKQALTLWCERFAEYGGQKRGVAEVVRAAMSDELSRETYGLMVQTVDALLAACAKHGDIDPGFDAEDFLQLLGLLTQLPTSAEGIERGRRIRALALRGLGMANP